MSDIVERLRLNYSENDSSGEAHMGLEAANEIERLRAALQEIVITDPPTNTGDWFAEWRRLVFRLKAIARRALEEGSQ